MVRPVDEVHAAISSMQSSSKFGTGRLRTGLSVPRPESVSTEARDVHGTGGEGVKFWMSVSTDIRYRGARDAFFGLRRAQGIVGGGRACRPATTVPGRQAYWPVGSEVCGAIRDKYSSL